jgi:hypothetical protein
MPATPSSSVTKPNDEIEHYIVLIGVCIAGYIGRAISKKLLECLSNTCCTGYCNTSVNKFTDALVVGSVDGESGVTLAAIEGQSMSWKEASKRLGHNYCAALSISILRLIFFHWSQPIGYGIALYIYYHNISHLQLILGFIVLVRECIYVILTLIALCVNPAFLLVDSSATFKSSGWNLMLYIICPEKFVYFCLGLTTVFPLLILIVCDLSGIAALIVAIYTNNMPIPLMIGYSITALGGLAALIFLVGMPLLNVFGCYKTSIQLIMVAIVNGTGSQYKRLDLSCVPPNKIIDINGILGALARNKTLEYLNLKNIELFVSTKNNCDDRKSSNSIGNSSSGGGGGGGSGSGSGSRSTATITTNNHDGRSYGGSITSNDSIDSDAAQERAIQILADSLHHNTTLIELLMDWSLIGTKALLKLYATNHTCLLTNLNLRDLNLNTADAYRLSNLINQSNILQVLDIANNNIGDQGAAAIASSLENSITCKLKGLDVSNNNIGDSGAKALSNCITVNQTLLWLFCYNNANISTTCISLLLEAGLKSKDRGVETVVGVTDFHSSYRNGGSGSSSSSNHVDLKRKTIQQRQHFKKRMSMFPDSRGAVEGKSGGTTTTTTTTRLLNTVSNDQNNEEMFSTLELTWEIQLEQLMSICHCTPSELKLMLERNLIYTKLNVFGAAKYRKLKSSAKRLLNHFQTIIGSRGIKKKIKKNKKKLLLNDNNNHSASSKKLLMLVEVENEQKTQFLNLLNRMIKGANTDHTNSNTKHNRLPSDNVSNHVLLKMKSSKALILNSSNSRYDTNNTAVMLGKNNNINYGAV